jgi:predicted nucleotidyltransferase
MSCVEIAKQFVEERFPQSTFALIAGSAARGTTTKTSDIDIVIIIPDLSRSFRESFFEYGWPIEVFGYNEQSYLDFFRGDVESRKSPLLRMCVEGTVIKDVNHMEKSIKDLATDLLLRGPRPLSREEQRRERFDLTNLIDDLDGENDFVEQLFIVNELSEKLCNFILVCNGHWQGSGKWIPRLLRQFDERLFHDLFGALEKFYSLKDKDGLVRLASRELAKYGGKLFGGYSVGKE